jgi:hypothetical protein
MVISGRLARRCPASGIACSRRGRIEPTLIPLSPLPEQRRIIAGVDALLAEALGPLEILAV